MNVLVGRSQRYSLHVHTDGNDLSLIRAAVHDFILDQSLGFCFGNCASSEGFLPDQCDLHAFDFDFDEMEVDSSNDDVSEMVERFIVFKIDMETILDSHFHLHRNNFSCPFDFFVRQQNCKVSLFNNIEFTSYNNSDKISHSTSNPVECLILLFEIREPELESFVLGQDASRLQLFRQRCELGAEILI